MGEEKERPSSPGVSNPALLGSGDATSVLLGLLASVQETLGRERNEAPGLCDELLSQPVSVQLGLVSLDRRFHTWGVCELLLTRSQETLDAPTPAGPADPGHLASLALAASEELDLERHAPALVKDLRAKIWACIGEARRQTGDLPGAEEALRAAGSCLAYGTGDLLVEARLLEFEAAVRAAHGRTGEALALLDQAAARYSEVNEAQLQERVLRTKERVMAE